jgi:hypothetical protein
VNRHATLDELARLGADDLKPRKAARIRGHLATCVQCTQLNSQLSTVPDLLSRVEFGPMPDNLSARIESALAIEARQRLASEPATEAGRGDLPAARSARSGTQRHGRDRAGWRLPGLSVAATRALATAGAIAVIGGGGYAIASHAGGGPATSASSASGAANAAVPGATASQAIGAPVNFGHGDSARSIPTVTSTTDFMPSTLATQAAAALQAARVQGVHSGPPVPHQHGLSSDSSGTAARSFANPAGLSGPTLAGCIGRFAPGHAVQLVEDAKFDGKPATIIITTAPSGKSAEVWVVGESCSASRSDLLDHLKVAHI